MFRCFRTLGVILTLFRAAYAYSIAATPPMGWNTWNHFGCNISEEVIVNTAEALVRTGLRELGYQYVIIDDCWHAPFRDNITQKPVADPVKFPSGIKHLADRLHSMDLKLGIYSDAGTNTCGGRFGSLDYEAIDASTYAEWGVDYLKYDNCFNDGRSGSEEVSMARYAAMSSALNATGRQIFYAMCNWGEDASWEWASRIAQSWRISGDIYDDFDHYDERCPCTDLRNCTNFGHHCAVTRILEWAAPLGSFARPGGWNDLDMLEVGNGNMTYDEYVTHFSMWALLKSPLILGNDLTNMTAETLSILTNKDIISINQDPLGIPARRLWKQPHPSGGDIQLWVGHLAHGELVVAVVNTSPRPISTPISFHGIYDTHMAELYAGWLEIETLWPEDSDGPAPESDPYGERMTVVELRPHQTKVWRIRMPRPSNVDAEGPKQQFMHDFEIEIDTQPAKYRDDLR